VVRVSLVGLIAGGHSGIPRYAAALTQALDRVAAEFHELELTLLANVQAAERAQTRAIDVRVAPGRLGRASAGASRILAEQWLAARAGADLLHFFDLSGPLLAPRRPFVTTVHDAASSYGYRRYRYAYKRLLQPWAARHARAVVAVSHFAGQEAVRRYGAAPAAIRIVHSGPGLPPETGSSGRGLRESDGRPYFLYVGTLGENKNVPFLVRAFERAAVDASLVLVGRIAERSREIESAVEGSPARDRIRLVHDADDDEVDALYRGALALCLPSRYEGFGFPALEAMARGCPVLESDIPALREVSGEGGLLLPVGDVEAWGQALARLAADESVRAELRARGAALVERYSWDECARGVCRVLVEAAT
jgi:glycosyltransferase involved in cell wall biosynthesis